MPDYSSDVAQRVLRHVTAAGFAVLLGLTGGCVDSGGGGGADEIDDVNLNPVFTLQAALEEAVDTAILAAVGDFRTGVESLDEVAIEFCTAPDASALSELRELWKSTFESWYRLSLYNFGPLNDDIVFPPYTFIDSLRLRGTDYLETVRSEISKDVDGDRELTTDYFRNKTFQRVGLLALESVIFETSTAEHNRDPGAVLTQFQLQPRKCEVLLGLTAVLRERAVYVDDGWNVAFGDSLSSYRTLFLDGDLDDGTEPVTQLLIAGQEFLDYLQARRVVLTAAQISEHAWQAVEATVDEVELLLRGTVGSRTSFFDVMTDTGNQNAVDAVQDSIAQVRQAIADRDADMLEITLGFLDGNFKREIPDSLDVELGINFSDGD